MAYDEELSFFGIMPDLISDCCYEDYKDKKRENQERLIEETLETGSATMLKQNFQASAPGIGGISSVLGEAVDGLREPPLDFRLPSLLLRDRLLHRRQCHVQHHRDHPLLVSPPPCPSILSRYINDSPVSCGDAYEKQFFVLDTACVIIFTVEYLLRLYAAPDRCKFFM